MTSKKRKRGSCSGLLPLKRATLEADQNVSSQHQDITHPVLSKYYPKVVILREWLQISISRSSRKRWKAITDFGRDTAETTQPLKPDDVAAARLLDDIVVGFVPGGAKSTSYHADRKTFSQRSGSLNGTDRSNSGRTTVPTSHMNDLVDFVIWLLFNKTYKDHARPPHMLCHGILRSSTTWQSGNRPAISSIPGLASAHSNEYAERLRSPAWNIILGLAGDGGEDLIVDLLLSCGLYAQVEKSQGIYYQICGPSLTELKPLAVVSGGPENLKVDITIPRKASQIRIVRNRILYARAAFNARGEIAFGLRHIHVLNRYPDHTVSSHTFHILKYIFPKQFRLHNVFTSTTNPKETVQPFQDYTLREKEIALVESILMQKGSADSQGTCSLPKRLRGGAFRLVQKLQNLHGRCSYTPLLAHYCPPPMSNGTFNGTTEGPSFTSLTTATAQVSTFCRAVVARVFPTQFFGRENWNIVMQNIDHFIKLRRFETVTLESLMQGIKIRVIAWLRPPKITDKDNVSRSDFVKRQELIAELMYYLFDSFLIPLIRSNFHVTESGTHRNRLFYFRHDVWRSMTEPSLSALKANMLEDIGGEKAFRAMGKQSLGFSQIRLLPKATGMRPITNLRRRMQVTRNGITYMFKSINSLLAPAFSVLNLEKIGPQDRLGSSMFSVTELYPRLQAFRSQVTTAAGHSPRFYFAKVDVQSCFDSLPQEALLELAESLVSSEEYGVLRCAQVRSADFGASRAACAKPTKRFESIAHHGHDPISFEQRMQSLKKTPRQGTVLVDGVVPQTITKQQATTLLKQHIKHNVIRIGKKYYRQKKGIAQGSVVSSLLCNLFFAQMEKEHLHFLDPRKSLLIRLIDDFLLLTTDRGQAEQFLHIMHIGIPYYGVSIKPSKSLTNFNMHINGTPVPRVQHGNLFPYCGLTINTHNLNVHKDAPSARGAAVADTLTVEYSTMPGSNFRRKTLAALKLQLHTMLLDTSYNTLATVWENLHECMLDVARKMLQYLRSLGPGKKPSALIIAKTVEDLTALACAMMRSKRNKTRSVGYQCAVSRAAVQWITVQAFVSVFEARQASFAPLVAWLRAVKRDSERRLNENERRCRLLLAR